MLRGLNKTRSDMQFNDNIVVNDIWLNYKKL